MTYLDEGFVMFYSGVAPNCLGSGRSKEVMQDIREVSSKPQMPTLSTSLIDALLQAKKKDRTRNKHLGRSARGLQMVDRESGGFLGAWSIVRNSCC